jgi:phospholipase A-2-activating protein
LDDGKRSGVDSLGSNTFVYVLTVLLNGDILSAGEDRTLHLWYDFDNTQTIARPAISVWAVSIIPNGDIISDISDGVVRIFSQTEKRRASADDLREYDAGRKSGAARATDGQRQDE